MRHPQAVLYIICLLFSWTISDAYGKEDFKTDVINKFGLFGPWVETAKDSVWPQPAEMIHQGNHFFLLDPDHFALGLDHSLSGCDILNEAVERYKNRFFPLLDEGGVKNDQRDRVKEDTNFGGVLTKFSLIINGTGDNKLAPPDCSQLYPQLYMDESYEIIVGPGETELTGHGKISASTVWGILRGLETASQLAYINRDRGCLYEFPAVQVKDSPRFPWRGIMLDSSRHFLSTRVIKENLDLMEINKMNVFHWHLTDDTSFPYVSKTFPELSNKGAYDPKTHVYTQEDIKEVVEYARLRGIRVVPEFATPDHTQSWGLGQPGLLPPCFTDDQPNGLFGPIDPTSDKSYSFLEEFFTEIIQVFPDNFLHLGGEEVDLTCWESNPTVMKHAMEHHSSDARKMSYYYFQKLIEIIDKVASRTNHNQTQTIWWEKIISNPISLNKNTSVVEIWKEYEWKKSLAKVTNLGYRAVVSGPYQLNKISYGSNWVDYYSQDPTDYDPEKEDEKKLVIGGEVEVRMSQLGHDHSVVAFSRGPCGASTSTP